MLFSGIPFLFYFLPCVLLLYFLAPKKLKNTVLLLTSLVFYGWGEPKFLILMIASILIGYVSGLLIEAFSQKRAKIHRKCKELFSYMHFFQHRRTFNAASLSAFCFANRSLFSLSFICRRASTSLALDAFGAAQEAAYRIKTHSHLSRHTFSRGGVFLWKPQKTQSRRF